MELEDKKSILKSHLLFVSLNDDQLTLIAQVANVTTYQPEEFLIQQDDLSGEVFFIISGLVKIYRLNEEGKQFTLTLRGQNEIIGEMAFIDDRPRSAFVEVVQETKALVLSGREFKEILLRDPSISISLLKILSLRIRENNDFLEDSNSLIDRTMIVLEALGGHFAKGNIPLSQEELAALVNASRARVTEALHHLEKQGKISLNHKNIQLL